MDKGVWQAGLMAEFKALLRTPVVGGETDPDGMSGVAEARRNRSGDIDFLQGELPYLVFDSDMRWFEAEDSPLIDYLAAWLGGDEETALVRALSGTGSIDLAHAVDLLVQWLPGWKQLAQAEITQTAEGRTVGAGELVGVEYEHWSLNRIPGTRYYTYDDEEYKYSDSSQAPAEQWMSMPDRLRNAAAAAEPWGQWFCTPTTETGDSGPYGGPFVFAASVEGPWVTRAEAEAALGQTTTAPPPAPPTFEDLQKAAVEAARTAGVLASVPEEAWLAYVDDIVRAEYDAVIAAATATGTPD